MVDNVLCMGAFGDTIRRLRKSARLSQDELAQAAGVSRATIQNAEKADEPTLFDRNYRNLAKALNLLPDQLDNEWQAAKGESVTFLTAQGANAIVRMPVWLFSQIQQAASAKRSDMLTWLRDVSELALPESDKATPVKKTGVTPARADLMRPKGRQQK